jgi:hypothetical protein
MPTLSTASFQTVYVQFVLRELIMRFNDYETRSWILSYVAIWVWLILETVVVELQSRGNIVLRPSWVPDTLNILADVGIALSKMIFQRSSRIKTVASDVVPTFLKDGRIFVQVQYIHWKGALSCFDCPRAVPLPWILLKQFAFVSRPSGFTPASTPSIDVLTTRSKYQVWSQSKVMLAIEILLLQFAIGFSM